jgi:hypothetical protein
LDPALFTAITALVVAGISASAQLWQTRLKSKADRRSSKEDAEWKTRREMVRDQIDALVAACSAIQGFQDELRLLSRAGVGSLSSEESHRRLLASRDAIVEAYRVHHPILENNHREAILGAKELAIDLYFAIHGSGILTGDYVELSPEAIELMAQTMSALALQHQKLLLGGVQTYQASLEGGL